MAAFNPATANLSKVTIPQSARTGGVVFWNESNISLNISFQDGTTMYLPGWYHRHKCGYAGDITWELRTTLNSPNPPTSEIIVEMYVSGEHFPTDGPIVRQTNGSAEASVTSTNAIVNTGNPPLTSIISAQPVDAVSATWSADNSGNLTIKSDNAGTLATLLQLIAGASPSVKIAAASIATEILGVLNLDGQVNLGTGGIVGGSNTLLGKTAPGDILDAGTTADTYLKSANNIRFQIAGTTQGTMSSNGLQVNTGSFYGVDGSNTIIQSTGTSGSGNTRLQNTDHISIQVPGGSEQMSVTSTAINLQTQTNLNGQVNATQNFFLLTGKTNRISNNNICAASHFSATFSTSAVVNHNFSNTTPNFVQIICSTASSSATVGAASITSTQVTLVNGVGTSLSFSGIATQV